MKVKVWRLFFTFQKFLETRHLSSSNPASFPFKLGTFEGQSRHLWHWKSAPFYPRNGHFLPVPTVGIHSYNSSMPSSGRFNACQLHKMCNVFFFHSFSHKSVENAFESQHLNPCCNGMKIELTILHTIWRTITCLNPYCNGMKIELKAGVVAIPLWKSLNPYCNGMKIERTQENRWRSIEPS